MCVFLPSLCIQVLLSGEQNCKHDLQVRALGQDTPLLLEHRQQQAGKGNELSSGCHSHAHNQSLSPRDGQTEQERCQCQDLLRQKERGGHSGHSVGCADPNRPPQPGARTPHRSVLLSESRAAPVACLPGVTWL